MVTKQLIETACNVLNGAFENKVKFVANTNHEDEFIRQSKFSLTLEM